ncbi:25466_t:CDS:2, partial [Gigaspora margarita]
LDPTIRKEIKKNCHCVVVSNNQQNQYSALLIVIPNTSDIDRLYSWEEAILLKENTRKYLLTKFEVLIKKASQTSEEKNHDYY